MGPYRPQLTRAPLVRAISLLFLLPVAPMLSAQPPEEQSVDIEAFTIPRPESLVTPAYPGRQAREGGEGLISVSFMVDTEGKPFDPVILDSTGDESFRNAALTALLDSRFVPAMLNGEPIVGSARQLYQFNMEGSAENKGVSNRFGSVYSRFQRAVKDQNREEIEEAVADLEGVGASNHYESAFLSLARYTYAGLFGTDREQILHINRALSLSSSPEDPQYLDQEMVRNLRRALLSLQVRNNYLAEAVRTYELIVDSGDEEASAVFGDIMNTVATVKEDDTQYFVPLSLDDSGWTNIRLYKDRFAMMDGQGELNEVVLRCDKHYVSFRVERDVAYDVPPEWGDCSLQIIGESGAEFLLMQD